MFLLGCIDAQKRPYLSLISYNLKSAAKNANSKLIQYIKGNKSHFLQHSRHSPEVEIPLALSEDWRVVICRHLHIVMYKGLSD
jgi:hypothetical protein